MPITGRDEYVDIAKGICMLLIIGIHTEAYVAIGMPLTFVSVPMFFFMSGMYDRKGVSLKDNVIKILKRLLWPSVIWLLIGTLFYRTLNIVSHKMQMDLAFDIYNPSKYNGPIWFLFALSYVKLFMWGLNRIGVGEIALFFMSIFMGYVGSTYQLPMHMDEGLAAMPFYCIGAIAYPRLKSLVQNVWLIVMGIAVCLFFTRGILSFMINPMGNELYKPFYLLPMLCILITFFPVLTLSQKISKLTFLIRLGQNSLGILLVHLPICMIMARIAWRIYEKETTEWYILSAVFYAIIVILSYYLVAVIKKYSPIMFGLETK